MSSAWDRDAERSLAQPLRLALGALHSLDQLDESLYAHYAEHGSHILDGSDPTIRLTETASRTLSGVEDFVAALKLETTDLLPPPPDDDDEDFDLGLGAQDSEEEEEKDELGGLDTGDIVGAVDFLGTEKKSSNKEKLQNVLKDIAALSYGLDSQLLEFHQRFESAIESGMLNQAMRELDDVASSLMDGVFAVITSICKPYVPEFSLAEHLPSNRSSLQKALLVRRSLADLRSAVDPMNDMIQDRQSSEMQRQTALHALVSDLGEFIKSEVFSAMRPEDRWEMSKVHDALSGEDANNVKTVSEGFAKFLESMLVVSRRDVVMEHDRAKLKELAEVIEAAKPIMSISPHGAADLLKSGMKIAEELYGLSPTLDEIVSSWQVHIPNFENSQDVHDILEKLTGIIAMHTVSESV